MYCIGWIGHCIRGSEMTPTSFNFSENKRDYHPIRATTTTTANQRPMRTLRRHRDSPHSRIRLSSDRPPRPDPQRRLTSTTTPISPLSAGPRLSESTGNPFTWCQPTKKQPRLLSSHCPSLHPSPDGMPPPLVIL